MKLLQAPIPKDTAIGYTENWRTYTQANMINNEYYINELLANAFTFDLSDFQGILNRGGANVVKIRIYFGMTTATPSPDPEAPLPMKAIMVGVDNDGKDIIYELGGSGIFDFATPCPSTCDLSSP